MINDYYCVWTKADERGVVDLSDTEPESGDSGKSKRVVSMCDWSQGDDFLTSFFDVCFFFVLIAVMQDAELLIFIVT